jgi:hypothetical protein
VEHSAGTDTEQRDRAYHEARFDIMTLSKGTPRDLIRTN